MTASRNPCTAKAKSTGEPCTYPPAHGYTVCRFHGGKSPNAIAGAQIRDFETRARNLLVQFDDRAPIVNPFEELLALASEVVAFKDAVGIMMGDLGADVTQEIGGANGARTEEQIRPMVVVYERAIDRCSTILAKIVSLGIEDRMARVTERQAETFARLIDGIVTDLGLNPTDPTVAATISRRLQLATG